MQRPNVFRTEVLFPLSLPLPPLSILFLSSSQRWATAEPKGMRTTSARDFPAMLTKRKKKHDRNMIRLQLTPPPAREKKNVFDALRSLFRPTACVFKPPSKYAQHSVKGQEPDFRRT